MAETKTQAKKAKPKNRSASNSKSRSKPKARSTSKPKAKSTSRAKPKSTGRQKTASGSKSSTSKPLAVLNTVEETAKDAGGAVGSAASKVGHVAGKAKVPLMAGGAALAGVAGGLAFGRQSHRHNGVAGVSSKDLAKAARKASDAGLRVGELALEGRRVRETRNGNGKVHRSPVEVVLQGLTSRR